MRPVSVDRAGRHVRPASPVGCASVAVGVSPNRVHRRVRSRGPGRLPCGEGRRGAAVTRACPKGATRGIGRMTLPGDPSSGNGTVSVAVAVAGAGAGPHAPPGTGRARAADSGRTAPPRSGHEPVQDRQGVAQCGAGGDPELGKDLVEVAATVRCERCSRSAICLLVSPDAARWAISDSCGVSLAGSAHAPGRPSGRLELAFGPVGPRTRAELLEGLQGCQQRLSGGAGHLRLAAAVRRRRGSPAPARRANARCREATESDRTAPSPRRPSVAARAAAPPTSRARRGEMLRDPRFLNGPHMGGRRCLPAGAHSGFHQVHHHPHRMGDVARQGARRG